MRKVIFWICMTACLMLLAHPAVAGSMRADRQGPNTPWGSYTETGRNTPWGSYHDTNRPDQRNFQQNRQYGRNDGKRHHDHAGYENRNNRQGQYRYDGRRNNAYRTEGNRMDTMNRKPIMRPAPF
jgi:hypothetical protein